jgi:hypothetical protein
MKSAIGAEKNLLWRRMYFLYVEPGVTQIISSGAGHTGTFQHDVFAKK